MFNLLEKKFKLVILLVISFSIIFVGIISYMTIKKIVLDNFINLSNQATEQQFQNVELYMKLIEETTKLIPDDAELLDALENSQYYDKTIQVLDRILASNTHILGVSLYDLNGKSYSSNNISIIPSLGQLEKNPSFFDFIKSDQDLRWIIRNEDMSDFYVNSNYLHKENGLFSFTYKIYKNERLLGYVLVDTDIFPLFNFFKNDEYESFKNKNAYIVTFNNVVSAPFNSSLNEQVLDFVKRNKDSKNSYKLTDDKNYIVSFKKIPDSDSTIATVLPLYQVYSKFKMIIFIILVLALVLLLISMSINYFAIKSITLPLKALYGKMQNSIDKQTNTTSSNLDL